MAIQGPYTATTATTTMSGDETAPSKASLRAWWNVFTSKDKERSKSATPGYGVESKEDHPIFGKPLKEGLKHASVQISTANSNGELYVWGYIPVVVAKCGLYLKENATEVEGTFRVNGSAKRMRELQALFEASPRYGKSLNWANETYTTHDVASVFRRYLTQMPEPVIPHDMYHLFRDALAKDPFNNEEVVATYKRLIRSMPRANQYLLLYVLDLLSVFARKCERNLMTATNLAVIFRPGLISHPNHEMEPQEHQLSQKVLEFLIAQQDWFMLDIPPPPGGVSSDAGASGGTGSTTGAASTTLVGSTTGAGTSTSNTFPPGSGPGTSRISAMMQGSLVVPPLASDAERGEESRRSADIPPPGEGEQGHAVEGSGSSAGGPAPGPSAFPTGSRFGRPYASTSDDDMVHVVPSSDDDSELQRSVAGGKVVVGGGSGSAAAPKSEGGWKLVPRWRERSREGEKGREKNKEKEREKEKEKEKEREKEREKEKEKGKKDVRVKRRRTTLDRTPRGGSKDDSATALCSPKSAMLTGEPASIQLANSTSGGTPSPNPPSPKLGATGVVRSRTLPTGRGKGAPAGEGEAVTGFGRRLMKRKPQAGQTVGVVPVVAAS